jgi:uncharacterized protein (TIGR02466 family)
MELVKFNYFSTPIYFIRKNEWLNPLNNICDKYIETSKLEYLKTNKKDFGTTHQSGPLASDYNFSDFIKFISLNAVQIIGNQGYDEKNYSVLVSELWVQEFSKEGGGHHNSHVHSNSHISGFYFLKCSPNTSYPIFHDPRTCKRMIDLPEKEVKNITEASDKINVSINPGDFIFFNSYLEHQFTVDPGIDPFRFIHFNLQLLPKKLFDIGENNKKFIN